MCEDRHGTDERGIRPALCVLERKPLPSLTTPGDVGVGEGVTPGGRSKSGNGGVAVPRSGEPRTRSIGKDANSGDDVDGACAVMLMEMWRGLDSGVWAALGVSPGLPVVGTMARRYATSLDENGGEKTYDPRRVVNPPPSDQANTPTPSPSASSSRSRPGVACWSSRTDHAAARTDGVGAHHASGRDEDQARGRRAVRGECTCASVGGADPGGVGRVGEHVPDASGEKVPSAIRMASSAATSGPKSARGGVAIAGVIVVMDSSVVTSDPSLVAVESGTVSLVSGAGACGVTCSGLSLAPTPRSPLAWPFMQLSRRRASSGLGRIPSGTVR